MSLARNECHYHNQDGRPSPTAFASVLCCYVYRYDVSFVPSAGLAYVGVLVVLEKDVSLELSEANVHATSGQSTRLK